MKKCVLSMMRSIMAILAIFLLQSPGPKNAGAGTVPPEIAGVKMVVEGAERNFPVLNGKPGVTRPGIYIMGDYSHMTPAQYPGIIVGGHAWFTWKALQPSRSSFNWGLIDNWIKTVTAEGKHAAFGVNLMEVDGAAIPEWVFQAGAQSITCGSRRVPKYWDSIMLRELQNFVRQLAARYDNDPRVEWIQIGTGIYGENQPSEDKDDACVEAAVRQDFPGADLSGVWVGCIKLIIDMYANAFQNKPVLLQFAPTFKHPCERKHTTDYAANLGVGLKHCGLRWDDDPAIILPPHSQAGCGQWDPFFAHPEVPLAWEAYRHPYFINDTLEFWGLIAGLNKKPDYFNFQAQLITETADLDFLRFINQHTGVTIKNTPSVWVALRETEQTWMPQRGNFDFFMSQDDKIPGGKTVAAWNVSTHKYGRYTRRTDFRGANPYMFFKVDDGYIFDGKNVVTVRVTYYDQGTGSFELEYDSTADPSKSAGIVRKTNTGRWLTHEFILADARFANRQNGADFRIDCLGDDDEYISFVQVIREAGLSPDPPPDPPPVTPPPVTPPPTPPPPTTPPPAQGSSVTLQQGLSGYGGAMDTFLNGWSTGTNYGGSGQLSIRTDDWMGGLLKFDTTSIPANAEIASAKLSVFVTFRSNANTLKVMPYKMRRAWVAGEANWNLASSAVAWGKPGANDTTLDREPIAADSKLLSNTGAWVDFDITAMVREWISNPAGNYGVALKGQMGGAGVEYKVAASEYAPADKRPKLTVEYGGSGTTPPPPPPPVTPPPTTPPPAQSSSVTLQQGLSEYAGAGDTMLNGWSVGTNYGGSGQLSIRTDDWMGGLLKFDTTSIPANAEIASAKLSVFVTFRSNANSLKVMAYKMKRAWVAGEANWNLASSSVAWGKPGANDTTLDREAVAADSKLLSNTGAWVELDITAMVREWVSNPAGNYGVALKGQMGGAGVEYQVAASEYAPADKRPKLIIGYGGSGTTPPPTPPPVTPPPVTPPPPPPDPGGTPKTLTFQQGTGGYTGVQDTPINIWNPKTNYTGKVTLTVHYSYNEIVASLIKFDLSQVPRNAQIDSATLSLHATYRNIADDIMASIYRVRRPWNVDQATWQQAEEGKPWMAAGANDKTDRDLTYLDQKLLTQTGTGYDFNVKNAVQDWVSQPCSNHGMAIRGYINRSVQYDFASSNSPNMAIRPKLTIAYHLKEGTMPPLDPAACVTPPPVPTGPITGPPPPPGVTPVTRQFQHSALDTTISSLSPSANYGYAGNLSVRVAKEANVIASILQFNLNEIPAKAVVTDAYLELYVYNRSNPSYIWVQTHKMLTPWNASQATWQNASYGRPWQKAGAGGVADRDPKYSDRKAVELMNSGYRFNVREMVQEWIQSPTRNYGVLIWATGETYTQYDFVSTNNGSYPSQHPKLVIKYWIPQ